MIEKVNSPSRAWNAAHHIGLNVHTLPSLPSTSQKGSVPYSRETMQPAAEQQLPPTDTKNTSLKKQKREALPKRGYESRRASS